ncbi:CBS domain-containing protein [Candidatus Woesearchaeota archaeon]|nr:CBS domain-containing protein [Candidatus Woesearchaeota archaeon]
MKTGIKVFDAMTTKPVTTRPDNTVTECAKIMRKYTVGSLLVKEDNGVIGIITELDFVTKIVAKGKNPDEMLARDIMETDLVTIAPDKDIYDAMMEMRASDIRRLPVKEDKKIVGFLTMKDIVKIEPQLFELMVEKIELREMKSKPISSTRNEEGMCESCGNFSYRLTEDSGLKVCPNCKA